MKLKNPIFIILISFFIVFSCSKETIIEEEIINENNNKMYFPPINSNAWETESISKLGWNENQLNPLLTFLEEKNTRSFIILYNGKIVVEKYFNNHNSNSVWYWASAGKTLTSTVVGIAQDENLLHISNKVSDYLGNGWTTAPLVKENLISSKNLLSMNSGLDDNLGDGVSPSNLKYIADAGERWAYHNVYVKLQDVIEKSTNQPFTSYFNLKLRDKIGMTGFWRNTGDLSVYWSNSRSMARFGLMILAEGKWNDTQIISKNFLIEATNTSQQINKSYGYLWWLNGKSSYHLPQSQFEFQGSLIKNAPTEMFAALGKSDQKIYIIPSKKLVIIRMGDAASNSNFALSTFDEDLWRKINLLLN